MEVLIDVILYILGIIPGILVTLGVLGLFVVFMAFVFIVPLAAGVAAPLFFLWWISRD